MAEKLSPVFHWPCDVISALDLSSRHMMISSSSSAAVVRAFRPERNLLLVVARNVDFAIRIFNTLKIVRRTF
jgi:hypothetical protein